MGFHGLKYCVIFLLLLSIIPSSAVNKIQVGDEWEYSSNATIYNEIALENFVQGDSAYTKIKTNRSFPFEFYQFTKEFDVLFDGIFSINIQLDDGFMFLTQGGGLPVWHNNILLGSVSFSTDDYSYFREFSSTTEPTMEWIIDGVVEQGLQVTTPTRYGIRQTYRWADNQEIMFDYHYLMTSFENNNYTIQYEDLLISFQIESPDQSDQFIIQYNPFAHSTRLCIRDNSVEVINIEGSESIVGTESNESVLSLPLAYKISLDDAYQVPIIIEQTEPIDVRNELSLSQESNTVTYLLVDAFGNENAGELDSPLSYNLISTLMVLIIARSRIKSRASENL